MHNAVKKFIKEAKGEYPYKFRLRNVLEVGSHNINGSPRRFFWFCNYKGVDISQGKGVDVVGRFCDLKFNKYFGVVISTECLEHDETWIETLKKMYALLKPGGLMIVTCAGPKRKEHGTKRTSPEDSPDTPDYYRNISIKDFAGVLPEHLFGDYVLQYARGGNDLQFYGIKNKEKVAVSFGVSYDEMCA